MFRWLARLHADSARVDYIPKTLPVQPVDATPLRSSDLTIRFKGTNPLGLQFAFA